MKTLPLNISAHPDGFIIRVVRAGVRYQAFTTRLERAIELRDRFLRIAGEKLKIRRTGSSNTGVVGVSETSHWVRAHRRDQTYRRPCFSVDWNRDGRRCNRRIYYGPRSRSRETAFAMACAFRARMAQPQPQT